MRAARLNAIDWLRGLVMMLMTIDHAGALYDAHHMHGDSARGWLPGSPLPAGEFLTRWVSHLCAPTFVLLAGAALALSTEKRRGEPGQTAFIVKRGLLIAALDPLWMSLGFTGYRHIILQVLFAIGMSMVAMALLRHLSTKALWLGAAAIQLGGEWLGGLFPHVPPPLRDDPAVWQTPVRYLIGALLLNGGALHPRLPIICVYPVLPWLAMMMAGWALGRWLIATRDRPTERPLALAGAGVALLLLFALLRGVDGYGNWGLHRDSLAPLQWLHVAKYPPSLSYTALELGIACLLFALFCRRDDGGAHPLLARVGVFGATAFFFYLLHVHLLALAAWPLRLDREQLGLTKTYLAALAVLLALAPLCLRYRRYKVAHPDGWTRYV